jgi:hypothetical protein
VKESRQGRWYKSRSADRSVTGHYVIAPDQEFDNASQLLLCFGFTSDSMGLAFGWVRDLLVSVLVTF